MENSVLSTLSILSAVVLGGLLLILVQRLYSLPSVRASKPCASLPKGSLGWPIIGESLAFLQDPHRYAHSRVKRYGSIFRSSLFLRRVVVGTTPEFAKFVAGNSNLFRMSFPKHVAEILGPKSFLMHDGPQHMSVKSLVLRAIRAEALRTQVHGFETIILENMSSWESNGTVNGLDATQKLTWDVSNWILFGDRRSRITPEGKKNFDNFKQFMRAMTSVPLNLPGTPYGNGIKARGALVAHFTNLIKQSKGQGIIEALLAARDDPGGREVLKELDDSMLADTIILINFAAYDTTSTTLVWILKFLTDYPDAFRRIQAEQQKILRSKGSSVERCRLTWEDTRNMVYTQKFIQEVQRYITLVPATVREATEDVTFGGHLIPKGWLVWTMYTFIHSDPVNYPDLSFNPDRFDVAPKPYTFLPFSAGPHMCPGIEVARLILSIVIHHLSTTYTFEPAAPDTGVEYDGVFAKPRGGYPINLRTRN